MKKIVVPRPKNDSLLAQLGSLYKTFVNVKPRESLSFDLSFLDWTCPLLILPISAHINDTQSSCEIGNSPIKSYLEKVSFPKGVDSISLFQQRIQKHKSFIPISVLKKESGVSRERLEALFSEKIYETLGNVSGAQNAVCYPIAELVTNIFEHSKEDRGFIFGQFYPNKKYLDICIIDRGRGFATAYKEEKGLNLSDGKAISEAMKGNSVKLEKERGYGIWTSKKIICDVLKGGGFILISGSEGLVVQGKEEKLVSFPKFYWQGSIIAYRIPKPLGMLDISSFLE
jgi:anti-sigma regulatory factor (Ser/Thr protein kinase)